MSWRNKVVWSEGMFLRPQHFQQFDRYVQSYVDSRAQPGQSDDWGFAELELDEEALALGRISIAKARGVFPDGTPFDIPGQDQPPPALEVGEGVKQTEVFLAIPLMSPGRPEVDRGDVSDAMARFAPTGLDVRDSEAGSQAHADLQVGSLATRFMLDGEEVGDFACLGVAEVVERRSDSSLVLNKTYIPTVYDTTCETRLKGFAGEIFGLVRHRAEALGARISQSGQAAVAEIADYLLLLGLNRYTPVLEHLSRQPGVHPEVLYKLLLLLDGELATFAQPNRLAQSYPPYRHSALRETFDPLMQSLRSALGMVIEANAVLIPLVERKYGIRVGKITDPSLLKASTFVLAVKASIQTEALRTNLPKQIKIGSVEVIRDLVNKQIPGIGVSALPVAPRQIPYHVGFSYFELDRTSQYWESLATSGGFALHVAGEYPDLELELWAIRG